MIYIVLVAAIIVADSIFIDASHHLPTFSFFTSHLPFFLSADASRPRSSLHFAFIDNNKNDFANNKSRNILASTTSFGARKNDAISIESSKHPSSMVNNDDSDSAPSFSNGNNAWKDAKAYHDMISAAVDFSNIDVRNGIVSGGHRHFSFYHFNNHR